MGRFETATRSAEKTMIAETRGGGGVSVLSQTRENFH